MLGIETRFCRPLGAGRCPIPFKLETDPGFAAFKEETVKLGAETPHAHGWVIIRKGGPPYHYWNDVTFNHEFDSDEEESPETYVDRETAQAEADDIIALPEDTRMGIGLEDGELVLGYWAAL